MNVEKIQKINNLALDLQRQGLAANREDAIAQAEKIYNTEDGEAYTSIKSSSAKQPESGNVMQHSEISQDSMKQILEQNTKFLVKTIREFQEKVVGLEKEMRSLKDQMNSQRIPTVNDLIEERRQKVSEETKRLQNTPSGPITAEKIPSQENMSTPEVKPEAKESHPRSGNFVENDVSIEKFFYYGNK